MPRNPTQSPSKLPNTTQSGDPHLAPRDAFRFRVGTWQFAADAQVTTSADGKSEAPITLLARSPEPIYHPCWGMIVHDMSGLKLRKERCPLDYCHWDAEPIGFGDQFSLTADGLQVSGKLISFLPNDRAAEVIFKMKAGVPYEASIDFSDGQAVLEEVPPGMTVQVNGYDFTGPGVVVRQWSLLGVAVCPFGADPHTSSDLADEAQQLTIPYTLGKFSMSNSGTASESGETTTTPAPQTTPPPETSVTTASPEQLTRSEMQRYVTRFGADRGTQYFFAGKNFTEALEEHCQSLQTQLQASRDEVADLKQRLSLAKPTGEVQPVSAGDVSKPDAKPVQGLSQHQAKFAAGIQLPGKK